MKLITRNTDYALRALCYIAKHRTIVSVDELVAKLGVPRSFMRKILQRLNNKKVLASCRGQGGGFKLKKRPERISVIDIICIFQGQAGLNACFLKKDICPNRGRCLLRKKILLIEKDVLSKLKRITIASLV